MAGGELVRIGAKRGAMAVWGRIVRLLSNTSLPAKVLEQILFDVLGNMIDDVIEGVGQSEGQEFVDLSRYGYVEGTVRVAVPSGARGIRWVGGIPDTYGRNFGGSGGVPVFFGDNPRGDRPGALFFTSGDNSYGLVNVSFQQEIVPFPTAPLPTSVNFVLNIGVRLELFFLKNG